MSAAHTDTPRAGWQQQSGQFLPAPNHSSGLHCPESFPVNVSMRCSDTSCKFKYGCFTSSALLIHIINKPHATDSGAVTHTSHRRDNLRKGEHWMTLTKGLTARDLPLQPLSSVEALTAEPPQSRPKSFPSPH